LKPFDPKSVEASVVEKKEKVYYLRKEISFFRNRINIQRGND
jgi:hypothetical protein